MNVLITEPTAYSLVALELYEDVGNLLPFMDSLSCIERIIPEVDVLVVRLGIHFDSRLLMKAKRLKYIVTPTTGLDHIDQLYCHENSIEIKQQLSILFERLLNEKHQINAPEIQAAFELFNRLRQAKITRGGHADMRESGIDCSYYENNGVQESVWAEDSSHTLTAWRGVLAALMMDSGFIYE